MKQVESDSQAKVKLGPGTLYGSLGRMREAGLIRESDKKIEPEMDHERRVDYDELRHRVYDIALRITQSKVATY